MTTSRRLAITPVREHHGGSRAELEAEVAAEGDPEIGYYHSNGAKAFNVGTKDFTWIFAGDLIWHF